MTQYQPDIEKSLLGEIESLNAVDASLKRQITRAQQKMSEAESEFLDATKVHGFLQIELERKRGVLKEYRDMIANGG